MLLPDDWLDRRLCELATLAPLQELRSELLDTKSVRLFIKRDDLLHPVLGGNKLYKLHGHLNHYRARACTAPILSFGGAHSNHLAALAEAGNAHDMPTIGVIRGERPKLLSPTLSDAEALGMRLVFVSRADYRRRAEPSYLQELRASLGEFYMIPEGGAGARGAQGGVALAEGISLSADFKPHYVCHACGTGTTVAGLIAGFSQQPVGGVYTIAVSVLKGYTDLKNVIVDQVNALGRQAQQWRLLEDYHGGGYAKFPEELASFMQDFETGTGILLDPVYTAKLMWAVADQIEKDRFPPGSNIVVVHSGGLQGRRGFGIPTGD